ncbi:MAG: tRNA lysidine(34) synthetase TilS [Magnetospirillum sp.]|nr:tRNA lysidine(34) synthetase TilS [Magnetospirillum sp.]
MAPLGPFEADPQIAVAVSGGPDSLALALLAADWAAARGGRAHCLTVDHRLRPQSTAEAETVGGWLAARGIAHAILPWTGEKPQADLQRAARDARYALLRGWCRERGFLHLLLAHHRDDQAETLLLRLGRGSGVDGLSGMACVHEAADARLVRPLLGLPRARLAATLSARGQPWIEDPSNANPAFARVRMRQLLPDLAPEGLTSRRLAETARRLGRARAALEEGVAAAAARWVVLHPAGFATIDAQAFALLPDEIGLRLVSRLVMAVGGGVYPPRRERLERIHAALSGTAFSAATLGGCRLAAGSDGRLLVCREAARMAGPAILVPGGETTWDGRFRLAVAADAPAGLAVAGLGVEGWGMVARLLRSRPLPPIPAPVRPTLPVVVDQDGISAVPHLGYNRDAKAERTVRWIVPAPANPLTVASRCLV